MSLTKNYYDQISKDYENISRTKEKYLNTINQLIFIYLKDKKILNFLEIGPGDGKRSSNIINTLRINDYTMIEESKELFNDFLTINSNVTSINKDYLKHNFKQDSFYYCMSLWNVFGHIKDKEELFKKIKNELKHKGLLIFDVNNRYNLSQYGIISVIKNILTDIFMPNKSGNFNLKHKKTSTEVYLFNLNEIIYLLKKNDFKIKLIKFVNYIDGSIKKSQLQGQIFIIAENNKYE